jgi:4-hydroxy-3-polyprenylbenzoate decarboxylase
MQALLSERYQAASGQLQVFGREQWTAPIASGSAVPKAMVICPCTSGTLATIASGLSRNLIERAADVVLMILVHRETPLSVIHLENMLRLAKLGALILPANPGFYHQPHSVNDLVDFIVARILDHLDIVHTLLLPWGESRR